jgi:hypothetical protein
MVAGQDWLVTKCTALLSPKDSALHLLCPSDVCSSALPMAGSITGGSQWCRGMGLKHSIEICQIQSEASTCGMHLYMYIYILYINIDQEKKGPLRMYILCNTV